MNANRILIYFVIFCASIIGIVLLIGGFVIRKFKESEPYRIAVKDARASPKIESEIGKVIGIGYWVAGEISNSSAELTFTVEGERRNLKVYYSLTKSGNGIWIVKDLSW